MSFKAKPQHFFRTLTACAVCLAGAEASATTSNIISMTSVSSSVTSLDYSYDAGTLNVTPGQSSSSPTTQHGTNSNNFAFVNVTLPADRKNDSALATQFNKETLYRIKNGANNNQQPGKLNFYFEGTLTINSHTFDNLYLAQMGDGTANPWWIAFPTVSGFSVETGYGNGHANICLTPHDASGVTYQLTFTKSGVVEVDQLSASGNCGA